MNTNKIAIYVTIVASVILIGGGVCYKVLKNNFDKLTMVTNKKVTEAAEKCYFDGVCKNLKITLGELYNNKYLKEKVIDPVKKRVYSEDSYIIITKEKTTFFPN